nr:hypothetical protein Iba_chr12bCG6470 [Ipomoea batatas]
MLLVSKLNSVLIYQTYTEYYICTEAKQLLRLLHSTFFVVDDGDNSWAGGDRGGLMTDDGDGLNFLLVTATRGFDLNGGTRLRSTLFLTFRRDWRQGQWVSAGTPPSGSSRETGDRIDFG